MLSPTEHRAKVALDISTHIHKHIKLFKIHATPNQHHNKVQISYAPYRFKTMEKPWTNGPKIRWEKN